MNTRKQVLFIEDDTDVSAIGVRQVRALGYTVLPAFSIAEGLDLFDTHGDAIGTVLSDNRLPDGLGMHLVARLRQGRPDLVAALISGNFSVDELAFIKALGVRHFTKPVLYSRVMQELASDSRVAPPATAPVCMEAIRPPRPLSSHALAYRPPSTFLGRLWNRIWPAVPVDRSVPERILIGSDGAGPPV